MLETWYHLEWGQPLQALIVDYICVALMVLGGIRLLARPAAQRGGAARGGLGLFARLWLAQRLSAGLS